jgi:TolB-like protein/Tfp pilus assembly protein PilF
VSLARPQREEFVASRCAGDHELRQAVERLLAAHETADGFIEHSPVAGLAAELVSIGRHSGAQRGPYHVGRRLASGGMGEIYEGTDTRTGGRVAIKVLSEDGPAAGQRLKREAAHALALEHPNICKVYGVGEDEAGAYIAMELLEGASLSEALPESGFDSGMAYALAQQLADAVAYAHGRGIIHRDLKSSNVMLVGGIGVKVLDFGLARRLSPEVETAVSAATLTETGVIAGTLSYLAPEVLKGDLPDCRSDVWAFGVVLHELLTGGRPFAGRTPFELSAAILREPAPDLPLGVPVALRIIRDNCLAKDPAARYRDAGEVAEALRQARSGARMKRRTPRRIPWRVVAAAIVALALGAGAWLAGIRGGHPTRQWSLAVLPLDEGQALAGQTYFGDGITEALIQRLGTIDSLHVMSQSSVMRFRGERSVAVLRRDLNADIILQGSVERQPGRVRVTAELDDAVTGQQLWHDAFDRRANEIAALENDVARAVVDRLGVAVPPARQESLRLARAIDPVVYEAYLQGRFQWNKRTPESLGDAIELFRGAIARDPTFAPAHAALADCYNQLGTVMVGTAGPAEMRPRAKAEAIAALQIDDALAEAHATLGYVSHYDWDWPTAEREFRRALALNPNLALGHTWYANYLVSRDRLAEAVDEISSAEQLDPYSLVVVTNLGWTLSYARRSNEAIDAYRRVLALDPAYTQARSRLAGELLLAGQLREGLDEQQRVVTLSQRSPSAMLGLAEAYAANGRREEARSIVQDMAALSRTNYVTPFGLARAYFALGDRDSGFAWLDRAFRERSNGMVYIGQEAVFAPFRDDPRYRRIRNAVGVVDGQ